MIKFKLFGKLILLKSDLLFILIIIVVASFYYDSVLDKGPLNLHVWRQTDCLSLTRNYSEGAGFFQPEMNIQLADNYTSGRSAGEFPILYFIVGMIWKYFGESYFLYRLFYLLILIAGQFAFYKSLRFLLKDAYWATVISLLLFTSPVYVVYGISFLTDAPAFSFILIALYFLFQYYRKANRILFILSMIFFALAGLLKVPSLIAFVFMFLLLVLESFSMKSLKDRKIFKCSRFEWAGFITVILVVFAWYYYAYYYNNLHNFKYTFNNIAPLWDVRQVAIDKVLSEIRNFTSYVFFSRPMLFVLFVAGITNLFLWKRIAVFAYLASSVIILGGFIYFLLWASLMGIHDYYYAALLIIFPGILLPFIWFIKTNYKRAFNGYILKSIIGIFLLYNFLYCLSVVKLKTLSTKRNYPLVMNKEFVEFMHYANWDVSSNLQRFEEMKPYMRKLGVKKEDRIISLPDISFNTSLYLVNQKGWTNFQHYDKKEDIDNLIRKGAGYLLISDSALLKKEYLAPFMKEKMGNYKGLEIFKLSNNLLRQ